MQYLKHNLSIFKAVFAAWNTRFFLMPISVQKRSTSISYN